MRSKGATGKVRGDPSRVRELFSRAVAALREGDGDLAAQLLIRADAPARCNASIRFNLGYAHHLAGRFNEAVACYRDCPAADPGNVDGWRNLFAPPAPTGTRLSPSMPGAKSSGSHRPIRGRATTLATCSRLRAP
ncbi:MAG: hypothetical protein M5U09_01210 [Gammaproteobacteria bacterium]|nr:hypothetical protein [Gammaproteobacteria bacterium]